MTAIERIQSLVEIRKPRVSEFFKDYDRLKHGIVTAEQFFRAFSNANIKFTEEEQQYIQERYGMHNVNGDFIDYKAALTEILGRKFNPDMAAQYGSLSGVTFESTAKMSAFDQKTYDVLKKLRQGQQSRPVIGKNFFLDYDTQGDGIINANQFSRGLSCMYEAFFREYPTEEEIELMVREFSVQRLEQVQRDCMESKEFSKSFKMQKDEVDYRAFCSAIGASGDSELQAVEHPKTDDPAYKEYVEYPQYEQGRLAFNKLLESHKRFRFDFKSFLQARDKRKVGTISLNLFIKALCDAINDLKRVGIEESEIEEVGKFFAVNIAYIKDSTLKPTNVIDYDETFVDYRKFLLALFEEQQNVALEDQKAFTSSVGAGKNILTSAPKLTTTRGLNLSNSGALGFSHAQGALGKVSDNAGHPIVDYIRKYIISRPVAFKAEFQEFDKLGSGRITSNQFTKVVGKFIPVFEPGSEPDAAPQRTEPVYRGGVYQGGRKDRYTGPYGVTGLYGTVGSGNRLLGQPGLTPEQLKTLARLYAVDTTSGVGTLEHYTPTPEKLSGGGFYIDYVQFCNDVRSEVTDFIHSALRPEHIARDDRQTLPAAWTVYFKIAESLNLRHLKLSDCLNEAAPGDARWNRTVQGRIGARSVQRSLSSLLGVQLSDVELAAVCLGCSDTSEGGNSALLLPGCVRNDDGSVTLPPAITAAVLAQKLDGASISAGKLVQLVTSCYDNWQPHRYTAYSYKSDRGLRTEVVNKAESEDEKEGQDVTHTAVKWLPDEAPQHLEHMIRTLGGDQIIYVKGQRYSLEELVRFAYESPVDVVNDRLKTTGALNNSNVTPATSAISATFKETQAETELVRRASRALLQLYYELHILRAQPILSFQEFDRPRAGYVTRDCFARAFVLAGLKRAIDFYPHSFQALTDLYTERGAGRFQNMVDYNLMLRELSQPPEQQLTIDQQEMERRTKLLRKQKDDYYTVAKEADEAGAQQVYDATVAGVLAALRPLCLKYRPKLRDQFLDFDRRRSGVCEASKLGAALGLFNADLNKDQMRALSVGFASKKPGFGGCFEWRAFVEALEAVCGCRL